MVVPPKHPKMIIFSRKTNGCLVLYHHFRKPPCQVQAIKKSPSHPPCGYRGTFGAQKHLPSGSSTKTFRRNEDKAITWFPKGETPLKLSGLEVEIRLSSARHAEQSCLGMDKSQSALTQHCISTESFRSKEISSTLNHLCYQKIILIVKVFWCICKTFNKKSTINLFLHISITCFTHPSFSTANVPVAQ